MSDANIHSNDAQNERNETSQIHSKLVSDTYFDAKPSKTHAENKVDYGKAPVIKADMDELGPGGIAAVTTIGAGTAAFNLWAIYHLMNCYRNSEEADLHETAAALGTPPPSPGSRLEQSSRLETPGSRGGEQLTPFASPTRVSGEQQELLISPGEMTPPASHMFRGNVPGGPTQSSWNGQRFNSLSELWASVQARGVVPTRRGSVPLSEQAGGIELGNQLDSLVQGTVARLFGRGANAGRATRVISEVLEHPPGL